MILITGGAGYIGSHMNKFLAQKGASTVVLDNLSNGHRELVKWGKFYEGNISDTNILHKIFSENRIDAVIHFAAFAYVGESVNDPAKYFSNNVMGTLTLLNAMLEYKVKTIIFSSTCSTYGDTDEIPISENVIQNPINPYAHTKLAIEFALRDYVAAYRMNAVALRYFNAAGCDPEGEIGEWHEPETHLIPLILDAALGKRENIKIFGTDYPTPDGTCIRDYIHVNDLAEAHLKALDYIKEKTGFDFFNLGTGKGYSVKEVISAVKKVTGKDFSVVEVERRAGDPAILYADNKKARKLLGWEPKYVDIEKIVETAYHWHQNLSKQV